MFCGKYYLIDVYTTVQYLELKKWKVVTDNTYNDDIAIIQSGSSDDFVSGHVSLGVVHYQLLRRRRKVAQMPLINIYRVVIFVSWIVCMGKWRIIL